MNNKAVIWLLLAVAAILSPLVFAYIVVFPLGTLMFGLFSLVMLALFAAGFLLLYAKFTKVKRNWMYMLAFLGSLLIPVIYTYTQIAPLVSATYAWMFLLMHFVLSSGVVIAYSQRNAIKKLF